jgi:nicotinamidase/pyrazinamidase
MNTLLWKVDTQYDFMKQGNDNDPVGKLYVPNAEQIYDNVNRLIKFSSEAQCPIVSTYDYHKKDSIEFSDNPDYKQTFPPHCVIGTKGVRDVFTVPGPSLTFTRDFESASNEANLEAIDKRQIHHYKFHKDEFNIFGERGNFFVDWVLKKLNPKKIVVFGVVTEICVNFAVLGLLQRGYEVVVIDDAIQCLDEKQSNICKSKWKVKGGKVVSLDSFLKNTN